MSAATEMKRREFLKAGAALGGGLLISLYVPEFVSAARAADPAAKPVALNAFVRIGTDETVTVISNHSEMGQGIYTSLPMLLNEELEADWARVRVESSPVDAVYNHTVFGIMMTGGSTTTNSEYDRFRKMGAMARIMLIAAAAQSWNVDPQSCHAEKGFVVHTASGRRATYGRLAEAVVEGTRFGLQARDVLAGEAGAAGVDDLLQFGGRVIDGRGDVLVALLRGGHHVGVGVYGV